MVRNQSPCPSARAWVTGASDGTEKRVLVRRGHRVVADGPYRWLRHPSYSGALLTFLGLGVLLGNWLSVAVLLLLPLAAYAWRMRVEEAVLEAGLGSEYAAYARGRPRLIPWLW